jgi:hypothetical protein
MRGYIYLDKVTGKMNGGRLTRQRKTYLLHRSQCKSSNPVIGHHMPYGASGKRAREETRPIVKEAHTRFVGVVDDLVSFDK